MRKKIIITFLMFITLSSFAAVSNPHWSYNVKEGPENWGKLSPNYYLCSEGKKQAPINIQNALKSQKDEFDITFQSVKQEIINKGHIIQISANNGMLITLDNSTFTLQKFDFHSPSENQINGNQFPLEIQFLYKNMLGTLIVLAIMAQEGDYNPQLNQILQEIPIELNKHVTLNEPVDIEKLFPKNLDFYYYSGSLTMPPCTEGVQWLVLKHPINLSANQIQQFHKVINKANNRPLQPLNGRIIFHSRI